MRGSKSALVLFVTAVLLAGGCDWVREPIVHAGQWELDLMDTVVTPTCRWIRGRRC